MYCTFPSGAVGYPLSMTAVTRKNDAVRRHCDAASAPLPTARGAISHQVLTRLQQPAHPDLWNLPLGDPDPYGEDVQLALTVLYELHYRGFDGVDSGWEWAPGPIAVRTDLERRFLDRLARDVPYGDDPRAEFDRVCRGTPDGWSVPHELEARGSWERVREFFVHRSIYQLKEADPQAWAIPRLIGPAKSAFVAVLFDEYGGGRPHRLHSRLFADLMLGAGLDDTYLGCLDAVPAVTLAPVNFMSACALHRNRMPELAGMFAAAEITTAPGARRMVAALEHLDAPSECIEFYAEHIEADAVHEQVLRHDVVDGLLEVDPDCAPAIVFGVRAGEFLEDRLSEQILALWAANRSSLRSPLGQHDGASAHRGTGHESPPLDRIPLNR